MAFAESTGRIWAAIAATAVCLMAPGQPVEHTIPTQAVTSSAARTKSTLPFDATSGISVVTCDFSIGPHHESGGVLRDAPDEQPTAHEADNPEHRLAGTSLQSLSEVGVPRIQPPPENQVAREEQ